MERVYNPPSFIAILSLTIPISKSETNLAKGEIVKANFHESQKNTHKFNEQCVGCEDGFNFVWRHIHNDYFKVVGKWPE